MSKNQKGWALRLLLHYCTQNFLSPLHNTIITCFVLVSIAIMIYFALVPQSIKIYLLFIPLAVMQFEHNVSWLADLSRQQSV
jgi:hypothetical protein